MREMAPSPVTLQAVPKESMAIYKAIIRAQFCSLKPRSEVSTPRAAMIAPPGTPGDATIITASMRIKPMNIVVVKGSPSISISATAQAVIFMQEPLMCIVAHRGIVKLAISSDTPIFTACSFVTGMVAALEDVPRAVK